MVYYSEYSKVNGNENTFFFIAADVKLYAEDQNMLVFWNFVFILLVLCSLEKMLGKNKAIRNSSLSGNITPSLRFKM